MEAKQSIIKCPHCNYEYLPCEIFVPGTTLGNSKEIIRDALGKILYSDYFEGKEPEYVEHYICDNCNKQFIIEAVPTYKVKTEIEELDFTNQTVSLLD